MRDDPTMETNTIVMWGLAALVAVLAVLVVGLVRRLDIASSQSARGAGPGREDAEVRSGGDQLAATLEAARSSLVAEVGSTVATTMASVARDLRNDVAVRVSELAGEKLESRLEVSRGLVSSTSDRFDRRVAEVDESLKSLREVVTRFDRDRSEQHADLRARLDRAATDQARLLETTSALGAVLLNPTARGAWGERAAGDLLARAGLVEGVSFLRQATLESGGRPDFTFVLPGGRHLHMDVKFPADNYMRALESSEESERARFEESFVKDVRTCISVLAKRRYGGDPAALDHVLLFIPNEAIHQFLHERDPGLLMWSLERDVLLCAPSSLLGVLGVLRETVALFHMERRSNEILDVLSAVEDQWSKFCEKLDSAGRSLDRLDRAFDELASTRTRGMQRQLDRVAALRSEPAGEAGSERALNPAHSGDEEASPSTAPRVPWSGSVAS